MSLVILKELLKLLHSLTKDKKRLLFCRSGNPRVGHKSKSVLRSLIMQSASTQWKKQVPKNFLNLVHFV